MNVRLVPGGELSPAEVARWRQLQDATVGFASPYFCPEFTQLVASVRADVEVAVMEEDGRVVGFLPFQRGRRGIARPVAAGYCDHQGVIAEPGFDWDARQLLRSADISAWHFDHLLAEQAPFQPFHTARAESPILDVSRGLEHYLAGRRRAGVRELAGVQRKMRKLEREHGPLRFALATDDGDALATLVRWKREQYVRSGVVDVLADPWIRRALSLAQRTQGDRFAGLLSCLYSGDRLIAAHLGIRSSSVWHWWFPAYDPDLARYSPGLVLLLRMIEAAPALGVSVIDLGKGEERYKRSLMTGSIAIATGTAHASPAASAAWRLGRGARTAGRRIRRVAARRRFSAATG